MLSFTVIAQRNCERCLEKGVREYKQHQRAARKALLARAPNQTNLTISFR